jgi:hypothetical protein
MRWPKAPGFDLPVSAGSVPGYPVAGCGGSGASAQGVRSALLSGQAWFVPRNFLKKVKLRLPSRIRVLVVFMDGQLTVRSTE